MYKDTQLIEPKPQNSESSAHDTLNEQTAMSHTNTNPSNKIQKNSGKQKRSLRKKLPDIALIIIFLLGLAILLYPSVSNWYNSIIRAKAIAVYDETVEKMTPEDFTKLWEEVEEYNKNLANRGMMLRMSKAEQKRYDNILNVGNTGMMGYISIPKIRVKLPIYHGVSDEVLQIAAGHIPGTSIPAGGPSTHTVLSGHRGLPSSKLFTDLDQLGVGDTFAIHVLDRTLAYKVDEVQVVEPTDVSSIKQVAGEDYVTLVTCTPYAINTHRLLVRGHRIDYSESDFVPTDAIKIDPVVLSTIVAVPVFIAIFVLMLIKNRRITQNTIQNKNRKVSRKDKEEA